ncbi:MAG: tetratricopeptide repeat protein [Nitrospira sp.]|nr:tetratricopeptide repeat protein [Nitrospira sp.]
MAVDKNTILEQAQIFSSRGQFDKAIAEWKKLADGTPADGTIYNTIGDLHLKRNAPAEAVDAYLQAAAAFRKGGAALKAIALYKKILKVDPTQCDAYRGAGDLNAERGLAGNAVSDYLILGKLYLKERKTQEALEVYRKIAALDPANREAQQHLAALASGEEGADRSVVAPSGSSGQEESARQDFINEAVKHTTAERYGEAEAVLLKLLEREPGDPEVCRILASLHLRRGELATAKAEFRFLVEAAVRGQDFEVAQAMCLEYLKTDPACLTLIELLGQVYEQTGDREAAAAQFGAMIEVLLEHPDPEQATLPAELYERIVALAPSSVFVGRFAPVFRPAKADDVEREAVIAAGQADDGIPVVSGGAPLAPPVERSGSGPAHKKRRVSYL